MEFKLTKPVEHDGQKYGTLTLREAELDDLIAMEEALGGELSKFAVVLARLSNTPLPAIKKLKASDLARLQNEAGHLLGNEDAAGET